MIFRKIRETRYVKNNLKMSLSDIEQNLVQFEGKDALAICPRPMGNSWQGVFSATEGLFGSRVFQFPQYYSNCIYSESELKSIGQFLINLESNHIVFSGYLPYFEVIIELLQNSGKRVSVIYHGSHTSVLEDPNAAKHFLSLIDMLRKGKLSKVGFVKKDMDKTFHLLTGLNFHPILLKTEETLFDLKPIIFDGLNIGVLTHDMFRKNLYNQISAALINPMAKVHLKHKYNSEYLGNQERIVTHGNQTDRLDFLRIMGGMDINYYVSFSECWGQFVNESLAMGVPCLTSDVSAVLDFDTDLKNMLTVTEFDNDLAIYKKSSEVLENRDFFEKKGPEYIKKLNNEADLIFGEFIS